MRETIVVTGAGGAAAIAFLKNLGHKPELCLHAADMDPHAAGLFLVPELQCHIIPAADDPEFVDHVLGLCRRVKANLLVPTVDAELLPLAARNDCFARAGISLLSSPYSALAGALDKLTLIQTQQSRVPCPRTRLLTDGEVQQHDRLGWQLPIIAKPRRGSGSRGVVCIETSRQLATLPRDGSYLLQELLPGEEYSVDVLSTPQGEPLVAVPRRRLKVDSGVAVTAATLRDAELESLSCRLVSALGLSYVNNVQWKRDRLGKPRLLEINPRLPGTLPLTIASGVPMPELCLRLWRGQDISEQHLRFEPTAMVRTWNEHFLSLQQLQHQEVAADELSRRACA